MNLRLLDFRTPAFRGAIRLGLWPRRPGVLRTAFRLVTIWRMARWILRWPK